MDAFEAIFSDNSKTTGSVRHKRADGTTGTAKLVKGPGGMSEEAFGEAAMHGTKFTQTAGEGDRARSRSRNGAVSGAAARSAVFCLLGFTPDPVSVPEPVKARGRNALPVPSENGEAAAK